MSNNGDSNLEVNGIAVIGMAGRFPGAKSTEEFWRNLRAGVESVISFTGEELAAEGRAPAEGRAGVGSYGVLDDIESFDASFFGFTPREAELLDPQQRIFLECAWEAFESAGYDPLLYAGPVGVFAGMSMSSYVRNLLDNPELLAAGYGMQIIIGNDKDHLATRVSYKLNLKGPSVSVQTACSTSLVAIHFACQGLLDYQCDMALAGGVSVVVPQKKISAHVEGGAGSAGGHCRAFDAQADGTIGGSGAGVVLLKRLADAVEDGDTILAVIRGSAINNDGSQKAGYTAPSVEGQAAVIAAAQAVAEVEADSVSYVEAHGTATPLGDPIEMAALTKAFRAGTRRKGFCAVGSVKTNIGHLDAAAGVAGVIKTVLALGHREIPPSLHFERPNPHIDFENSPFYVNTELKEWKAGDTPRRAGVSSFGLGGTNAHLILEEWPGDGAPAAAARPWQLLLLSARTPGSLEAATDNLAAHLRERPGASLADVAYTLQVGRRGYAHRRALVCRDAGEGAGLLSERDARQLLEGRYEGTPPPVVFMFPGLGNHYVGMGRDLYRDEPVFREHVARCCELLKPHLGADLRDLLYEGWQDEAAQPQGNGDGRLATTAAAPEAKGGRIDLRGMLRRGDAPAATAEEESAARRLNQTKYTQPALFVVEYALAQWWLQLGVRPRAMIGYSIGEYVAACVAGVLSLEDALLLVAARAQMIQELPGGSMLAVTLSEQEARARLGGDLHVAAVTGPSVCVMAGPDEAVSEAERRLSAGGVVCRRLPATHAFHSPMMEPTVARFKGLLRQVRLRAPQIPFVSNLTGRFITEAEATDADYWARHMCEPVRFSEGLETLLAQESASETLLLEVGPGQALSAWALQHPAGAHLGQRTALPSLRHSYERGSDAAYLLKTLGRLWLAGADIEWRRFHARERRRRVPLPTYPFERQRYWVDAQAGGADAASRAGRHGPVRPRKNQDLADWFYLPLWRQSPLPPSVTKARDGQGEASTPRPGECCLVFADDCGLAEGLAARLGEAGHEVVFVSPGEGFERREARRFAVNPAAKEDYERLLAELRAEGRRPNLVLHSWSLGREGADTGGRDRFRRAQRLGFYSLLYLAQGLAAQGLARSTTEEEVEPLRLYVLSQGAQEVTGAEELRPENATLLGVCKSLPQEYPNVTCVSLDLALPEPGGWREQMLVEQLAREISSAPSDLVVGYRGGKRWTQTFEPVRLEGHVAAPPRLRQGGVYWLTGGLGRDSFARAFYLAQAFRARLTLSGRSAFPAREDWPRWLAAHDERDATSVRIRKLLELEELGAEVLVLTADVASEEQMRDAAEQITRRFGDLHGVVHAAGMTTSELTKEIARLGPAECEEHFRPKVYGLYVLEEVLRGRRLDFCLLTSSVASIIGGVGLLAYTSASIFMDAFAHSHNRTGPVQWTSLNWQGTTPQNTAEAFRRVLSMPPTTQVSVSAEDLRASIEHRIKLSFLREAGGRTLTLHPRPTLRSAYAAPRDEVERQVVEVWQKLLGVEQVGVHDSFLEMGGDSLLALQLIARLRSSFDVELQVRDIFETPTAAELARSIVSLRQTAPGDGGTRTPSDGGDGRPSPHDDASRAEAPADLARHGVARAAGTSLVRIQAGGSKRPFFCVHPAGGNVFCYISLARHLGADRPFYGLQSPGLGGGAAPASVEEMAALYLEELRAAARPGAPHMLGGWSMGGLVAYEMARQLRARGEEVSLLALIDISTTMGKSAATDELSVTTSFAQELALMWNHRPTLTRAELERLGTEEQLALILEEARKTGNLPAGVGIDSLRLLREVFRVNVLAMRGYVPQPFDGKVTLLKAEGGVGDREQAPDLGWAEWARGGVEIHLVPGNHYSLVREPHVSALAETLKGCIVRAEEADAASLL